MILYGFAMLIFSFTEPLPVLGEAQALEPQGASIQQDTFIFNDKNMACTITYLPYGDLLTELKELGATAEMLEEPQIRGRLTPTVAFRIHWRNLGQQSLSFNPDQITLEEKGSGPCASMFDVADFWPPALTYSEAERVQLARAFTRGTIVLQPQEEHQQLVVFNRFQGRFPKKIILRLERIYYGIETLKFACGYRVRYPK